MAHIYAFISCTRVKWACEGHYDDDFTLNSGVGIGEVTYCNGDCESEAEAEHGWVDWNWSPYVLFDGRNEVGPVMKCDENDESLASDVQEALGRLEGGYEDNGDGTFYAKDSCQPHDSERSYTFTCKGYGTNFYAKDSCQPHDSERSYTYALHFTRKGYGTDGWYEEPWHPFKDGRLMWHEGELTGPHVDYPHGAGTLYDCFACEKIMNEED